MTLPGILLGAAAALVCYTYLLYPLLLGFWGSFRPRRASGVSAADGAGGAAGGTAGAPPLEWPLISITVPVYNEEAQIRGLLESLLALDYPVERRQILIVSDASTDQTDEIVAEFAARGVELLRMPQRFGKTAAENAARARLRGEIIINTDASIRIDPGALKPLIARFADPTVGVASGRDVSVARQGADSNAGESGYVGYEMTVRALEDRVYGIIGASGCFYGIRAALHGIAMPESLSRDFGAALNAREHGYRAVSVAEAACYVPRAGSLQREYRRKVRTMIRGMQTLHFKRHLLNPLRYGVFAWMLFSHKICRWLVPWALVVAALGIILLAPTQLWARWATGAILAGIAGAAVGWWWPAGGGAPRIFALAAFLAVGNVAALHASLKALLGAQNPVWEPTRREPVPVVMRGEG